MGIEPYAAMTRPCCLLLVAAEHGAPYPATPATPALYFCPVAERRRTSATRIVHAMPRYFNGLPCPSGIDTVQDGPDALHGRERLPSRRHRPGMGTSPYRYPCLQVHQRPRKQERGVATAYYLVCRERPTRATSTSATAVQEKVSSRERGFKPAPVSLRQACSCASKVDMVNSFSKRRQARWTVVMEARYI